MADYPEHEKLAAVSDESQAIGEFIENSGYVLAEYDDDDRLYPVTTSINKILAEYFGIDLNKIEEEKRAMLDEMPFTSRCRPVRRRQNREDG